MGPPDRSHVVQADMAKPTIEGGSASMNTGEVVTNAKYEDQKIKIDVELPKGLQEGLIDLLKGYKDTFVRKPKGMAGIPRSVIKHRLNNSPIHTSIVQNKCMMPKEINEIVNKEVTDLVVARVLRAM